MPLTLALLIGLKMACYWEKNDWGEKKKQTIMIIASQKCGPPELERPSNCHDFGKCQNQRYKQTVCFDWSRLWIKPLGDSAVTLNTSPHWQSKRCHLYKGALCCLGKWIQTQKVHSNDSKKYIFDIFPLMDGLKRIRSPPQKNPVWI